MRNFRTIVKIGLLMFISINYGNAQSRPPIWGIAKITFLVSDFQLARDYYGRFLGFDEAFSYGSSLGKTISFKVQTSNTHVI